MRDWLQGRDNRSPVVILSMARNLPEGSPLVSVLSAQNELALRELKENIPADEYDEIIRQMNDIPELDRLVSEKRIWTWTNTLLAMQLNRSRSSENEPVLGPEYMWPDKQKNKAKEEREPKKSMLENFFGARGR